MTTEVDLDFDSIKANLKAYLQSQAEFTDHNFEGSAMNVLMDALAYATHYNAVTANMAMSEAFLDSAQIRKNVVARVKDINYFPRQISSALATINLSITPAVDPNGGTGGIITAPKGTRFTSSVDNSSFTFVTTDDVQLDDLDAIGTYESDITINQGVFRTQTFIKSSDPSQRFILAQEDVDANESYFTVNIRLTAQTTAVVNYSRSNSIVDVSGESEIYYIQEAESGNIEIYFGDGNLGKVIVDNNAIDINYLVTKGKDANDASVFTLIDNIIDGATYNISDFTVTTVLSASGGSDEESIESIKFNAPLVNATQERAITVPDYRALLLNRYSAIQSLNVWGGEDNIPPQYGKVFIAVKPVYGLTISPATKQDITDSVLTKYSAIGITPEIIDAEYTYINVTTLVTYDDEKTILKIGELTTLIINGITTYFDDSVSSFSTDFRFSKLTSHIDGIDGSIVGNNTSITLSKKITPVSLASTNANLQYNAGFNVGTVQSNVWIDPDLVTTWEIRDDSLGKVHFYKDGVLNGASIGLVDYVNGIIDLIGAVFITQTNNQEIVIEATPTDNNVQLTTNNIMLLGNNVVTVEKLA